MSLTMLTSRPLPASAECRCVLDDGRLLTITASRRPRANRAEVKCAVAGAPAIAERMQEVVRLARHTEARFDSREQVVLSMDIAPTPQQREWELAAVLADRMVRGAYQPPAAPSSGAATRASAAGVSEPARVRIYAHGWSDAWHLGQVSGQPLPAIDNARHHLLPAGLLIAGADASPQPAAAAEPDGVQTITHLGALHGHADPSAAVSSARAWFPLHSGGINDSLDWVEVSVYPLATAGADEEDTIAAPGLDLAAQTAVRQTLAAARHFDGKGLGRWRTVVRFGQPRFQGDSYQLALVMADRLARGREFVPRGRLIASGCSSAWHAGRVDTVEGREPKLELILKQAAGGDRVLLPSDWHAGLPPDFAAVLRAKGASLACIAQIGMI